VGSTGEARREERAIGDKAREDWGESLSERIELSLKGDRKHLAPLVGYWSNHCVDV
jgi:hypothetical protein